MSKTTIRFGLIGCGMIAKLHAGALSGLPGAELAGVCDPVPGRAEAFVLENGGRAYPDTEAMLTDPEVDAVCICTPSGTHAGLAVQAARAGKHIVSEKPVAITQEQLLQVEEACRVSDVKFCCISQLRFSAAYQKIRQAVQDKKFGSFVCGDIYMKYYREPSYYSQSGWRGTLAMDGGGALMNQGIHGVDLLLSLMGPVKSIFARSRTLLHSIEVEDTLSAVVEYASGALGVIQATTSVFPGYGRRLELNGTKGSAVLTEDQITQWDFPGEEKPLSLKESGVQTAADPAALAAECHRAQLADMADAIRTNRDPLVDFYEGKKAVELILAIYKSAQTGQPVFLN